MTNEPIKWLTGRLVSSRLICFIATSPLKFSARRLLYDADMHSSHPAIKGLGGFENLFHANPQERKIKTCILTKGMHATFLPQLSTEDLMAVKLKFQAGKGESLEVVILTFTAP